METLSKCSLHSQHNGERKLIQLSSRRRIIHASDVIAFDTPSMTGIHSLSFAIPVSDTEYNPCSSPTFLSFINLFGRRAIARCASLSDKSMLLSLHAPKSRAAHSPHITLVMSEVGSSDAPWRGDHSAIAFVYTGTSDGGRNRR